MSQELVAESRAVRSAFDQARDIRHHKASRAIKIDYAEDRIERCEMIVGDPGLGVAGHGQKRRFSDIREADKTDVRDHFQLQKELQCAGGLSGLRVFGRLHCGSRIVHISVAALAALQDQIFSAVTGHIRDHFSARRFTDHGSLGYLDDHILTLAAGASALLAGLAVFSLVFADVAEISQRIEALVHLEDDASAVAAVAAVRAARGYILLSSEGYVPVAAFAAAHDDLRFIYKHVFVAPHAFAFVFVAQKTSDSALTPA